MKKEELKKEVCEVADEKLSGVSGGESAMDIVDRVIKGDYGHGTERKDRLRADGYDYGKVEETVKERLGYGDRHKFPFDD